MSDRRRARRHKSRRQNLCSKACTPTNALAETRSVSSPPEKSRQKLRRSRSSAKTRRSAAEGRLISRGPLVVGRRRNDQNKNCHSERSEESAVCLRANDRGLTT